MTTPKSGKSGKIMPDWAKDLLMFVLKTLIFIMISLIALSYNGIVNDIKDIKSSQLTISDVHEAISKRIK